MRFEPIFRSVDMRLSARTLIGIMVAGALMSARLPPLAAQTLADVARQEEERRKELKSQTKVITNKDLRGQVVGPQPPPPDQAGDPASSKEAASSSPKDAAKDGAKDGTKEGAKDAAPTDSTSKGETYWRDRIKSLHTALDRDQMHLAALQSRINALTTDFVNRDDPAQRAQIEGERKKSLSELERMQKQVEDDKKALAAAQSEGRRAGAQADWLR
jgi:hypothetical protein